MRRHALAWSLMAGGMIAGAMPAQAAGFFDDIARAFFTRPAPMPPRAVETFDPLTMTVKPQRPKASAAEVSSKPAPPVVKLDPGSDPYWYLRDPTLRRGDIVVTNGGVLVYQGGSNDQHARADFTGLSGSKPGAKAGWQQQLQAAAAGGRSFFRDSTPVKATLTASTASAGETLR